MRLQISRKQQAFIRAGADEVLFGGAAGGGILTAELLCRKGYIPHRV